MRLLDRIRAEGFMTASFKLNESHLSGDLGQAQLVLIENVAQYYRQEIERKKEAREKIEVSDFPNVMLPFEQTFLEMRLNSKLRIESVDEAGLLMLMFKASDAQREFAHLNLLVPQQRFGEKDPFYAENVEWYLTAFVFVSSRSKPKVLHAATFVLPVNAEGQILPSENVEMTWMGVCHMVPPGQSEQQRQEILQFMAERFLYPGLLAISFMHCRNVKVVTEYPPAPLSKKHERWTGRPLIRYRLLQIDRMKQVLERRGHVSTEGLKNALHFCRGHFKHYGYKGRELLFAKYRALVWRPLEVRGTVERGIVDKDYEVK